MTDQAPSSAARRWLRLPLLALLLTACSVTSRDSHDVDVHKGMRCVLAHDEVVDDGSGHKTEVRTLCDRWEPVPTPEASNG